MSHENTDLPLEAPPPAFRCIVYIQTVAEGGVQARVANLDGFVVTASDERSALAKIVPLFREHVSTKLAADEPVDWVDPPHAKLESEVKRMLPVHL